MQIVRASDREIARFGGGAMAGGLARRRPTAAPPFVPPDPTHLQLWVDTALGGTIIATGTNVTDWTDESGNAFPATAIGSPQYAAGGGPGGKDCVTFNGSTGLRYGATNETVFHINAGFTVHIVAQSTSSAVNRAVIQKNDSFTDGFGFGHGNTVDLWSGYYTNESTQFTPTINNWFYATGRYNGVTGLSIWNGATKLADNSAGTGTNNTSAKMAIGGIGSPYGWIGGVARVMFWNSVLIDSDVDLLGANSASVFSL